MFRRDESDRLGAMLLQRSRRPSVDPPADEDPPAEENIVVRGTNAVAILAVASRTRCALMWRVIRKVESRGVHNLPRGIQVTRRAVATRGTRLG